MKTDFRKRRILYVDDEKENLDSFRYVFRDEFEITVSESPLKALNLLKKHDIPVVISDQRMPHISGIEFIEKAKSICPNAIFILLTAYADIDIIVHSMNELRVFKYIQKPWHAAELKSTIDAAIELYTQKFESKNLYQELEKKEKQLNNLNNLLKGQCKISYADLEQTPDFNKIVTKNKQLSETLINIEQIAISDAPVLIMGETGTGKELIAQAIHSLSSRSKSNLIKVNCPALPESLIESELFGYEKGAFTGASHNKAGRFELAEGGTIFLDEIGELPLHVQPKLLRILQQQEYERIGGEKTIKSNVRIIAATNRNLSKMVSEREFRDDLFYRLNVLPVYIPPLRERKEDIIPLAINFLDRFTKRYSKIIRCISVESMKLLTTYCWPGNVRELENIIERAVILCFEDTLKIDSSFFYSITDLNYSKSDDLETTIRNHILSILQKTNWKIYGSNGAAQLLKLKPTTLQSKMIRLGIQKS